MASIRRGTAYTEAPAQDNRFLVFINATGPYVNAGSGRATFPGTNQSHDFGTVTNFRAFIHLHELGHQLDGKTGFVPDAGNPAVNFRNSQGLLRACF